MRQLMLIAVVLVRLVTMSFTCIAESEGLSGEMLSSMTMTPRITPRPTRSSYLTGRAA